MLLHTLIVKCEHALENKKIYLTYFIAIFTLLPCSGIEHTQYMRCAWYYKNTHPWNILTPSSVRPWDLFGSACLLHS